MSLMKLKMKEVMLGFYLQALVDVNVGLLKKKQVAISAKVK